MTVTCPWGNVIHLYDIAIDDDLHGVECADIESTQKMVNLHRVSGAYGPHRMAVRGNPGIRYVEIACKKGSIDLLQQQHILPLLFNYTKHLHLDYFCIKRYAFQHTINCRECAYYYLQG